MRGIRRPPGTEDVVYSTGVLTVAMATEIVALMPDRKLTPSERNRVEVYAREIEAGRWRVNGDPICFDVKGRLLDGWLRLLACIMAGIDIPVIFVHGLQPNAALTLGSHVKRTMSDILDINGEPYPYTTAASWPVIVTYLNAVDKKLFRTPDRTILAGSEASLLTERYPAIRETGKAVAGSKLRTALGAGVAGAVHYLMFMADPAMCARFLAVIKDPSLDPDSPPAILRSRIGTVKRYPATWRMAVTVKAWNAHLTGTPLSGDRLTWHGPTPANKDGREAFPEMLGLPDGIRIDMETIRNAELAVGRTATEAADVAAGVTVSLELVTPAEAETYLENNGPLGTGRNRSLRAKQVHALARDMVEAWVFNGQPLKFGASGRLLDGQHRCAAAVRSGKSFVTLVVRGLPEDAFTTFDLGDRKSLGRHLKDLGVPFHTSVAACVATLSRMGTAGRVTPTVSEGIAILSGNAGLNAWVERCETRDVRDLAPRSVVAPLMHLFARKDPEVAERFFHDLTGGRMLDVGDPVHTLRDVLMKPSKLAAYPIADDKVRLFVTAWNARRRGEALTRFPMFGPGFPEIV